MKGMLEAFISIPSENLSVKEFMDEVPRLGFITDYVGDLVRQQIPNVPRQLEEVKLVAITLADLGFKHKPFLYEFLDKEFLTNWSVKNLWKQCLLFCEPWDALQLFLKYPNEARRLFLMGMRPIKVEGHDPVMFEVSRNPYGNRWIGTMYGDLTEGRMKRDTPCDNFVADVMEMRYELDKEIAFRLISF